MNELVKVKICGMTREADIDVALSLGADYIGFIVYSKSLRGLCLKQAEMLAAAVPVGKRVVVDVEMSPESLKRCSEVGFDYFQIHGRAAFDADYLAGLSDVVGRERLWLAPRLYPEKTFPKRVLEYADTILLDTYSKSQIGGTGESGDWRRFSEFSSRYSNTRFILAGGISPENVQVAIKATGINHVDVNSGVELEPGKKSPKKLRKLFRSLRS